METASNPKNTSQLRKSAIQLFSSRFQILNLVELDQAMIFAKFQTLQKISCLTQAFLVAKTCVSLYKWMTFFHLVFILLYSSVEMNKFYSRKQQNGTSQISYHKNHQTPKRIKSVSTDFHSKVQMLNVKISFLNFVKTQNVLKCSLILKLLLQDLQTQI